MNKQKLLIILGPTSTGKTDLALKFAKKFNGELVSCDSRQVYVGLDIGTGKLPSGKWRKHKGFWEVGSIKIWMYDVANPQQQYTVADYVEDANKVIRDICRRGKLPIVVGGTGLYLRALIDGLSNLAVPVVPAIRSKLQRLSLAQLQSKLQKVSPEKWKGMNSSDRQNPRRLLRAIELSTADRSMVDQENFFGLSKTNDILKIGLTSQRDILFKRIDDRVVLRIQKGMIEEAKKLHHLGLSLKRMKKLGLEYGVLADYLKGGIKNLDELVKIMQQKIHGFLRRQVVWFKKEKGIKWFDIANKNCLPLVEKVITKWYHLADVKEN